MQVNNILASLSERFCQRRALRCLFRFLPAYFSINGLTDGWEECLQGLKELRAYCKDDLQADELNDVSEAINLIHNMLDKR